MEMEISSINKTLEQLNNEINETEIFWLRQQHELVKLSQERDTRAKDIKVLTKKITILEQKKLRVENEIEGHNQEFKEVQRNIQQLRNQLDKVNTLLHVEENNQDKLEQGKNTFFQARIEKRAFSFDDVINQLTSKVNFSLR